MDADGCRFTLHWEGETAAVRLPVPGEHMVRNAVLAVAAGLECGLGLDECAGALASARLSGGRLARRIVRGVIFFDDTYNANPDSMEAALRTLKAVPVRGRRIAVLGRMGELGDHASAGYQQVGRTASETLDVLIAVGAETVPLTETARGGGLREIYEISSPEEAAGILRSLAKEGDAVLVKGSRSAKMERVIENF
jgi:UDP-N-acetylmuramyl pentapeptide synthase